jgi:hypothetical protein
MIVIPVGILFVLAVPPVDESNPFEGLLLTGQTPVGLFFHLFIHRTLRITGWQRSAADLPARVDAVVSTSRFCYSGILLLGGILSTLPKRDT